MGNERGRWERRGKSIMGVIKEKRKYIGKDYGPSGNLKK